MRWANQGPLRCISSEALWCYRHREKRGSLWIAFIDAWQGKQRGEGEGEGQPDQPTPAGRLTLCVPCIPSLHLCLGCLRCRLGYQPPEEVSSAALDALEEAMAPPMPQQQQQLERSHQHTALPLPQAQRQHVAQGAQAQEADPVERTQLPAQHNPLPPAKLSTAAKRLASLQVHAPPRWCSKALEALLAAPGGEQGGQ